MESLIRPIILDRPMLRKFGGWVCLILVVGLLVGWLGLFSIGCGPILESDTGGIVGGNISGNIIGGCGSINVSGGGVIGSNIGGCIRCIGCNYIGGGGGGFNIGGWVYLFVMVVGLNININGHGGWIINNDSSICVGSALNNWGPIQNTGINGGWFKDIGDIVILSIHIHLNADYFKRMNHVMDLSSFVSTLYGIAV